MEEMSVMKTIKTKSESHSGQGTDARQRLAQLAVAQGVPVVRDVADLAVDFWPEDESADDINSYIYRQRYDDRIRA